MSTLLPMLATAGRPADVSGPAWQHEFKWDGVRVLAATDGATVTLRSRLGNDVTVAYPELDELGAKLGLPALVDGEVVALEDGVPSFSRLQSRMHLRNPQRIAVARSVTPVQFLVFDVLMLDGEWLLDTAYVERRDRLESLDLAGTFLAVPPRSESLASMLEAASDRGLEGVVSKRRDSRYRPGERSRDWRKLRLVTEQEFVVVGYRPGQGSRDGRIGALLVGYHDEGRLRLAGAVGSGLSARTIEQFERDLVVTGEAPVTETSEPDAVWVEPTVVVQVRYREWTPEGRLRQPTYRGRRPDIDPADVTRERD